MWIRRESNRQARNHNFKFSDVGVGVRASVMETFEKVCVGSAVMGFMILVAAILVLFGS